MDVASDPVTQSSILPKDLWNSGILREPPKIDTDRENNCCFHPQYPVSPRAYLDEAGIVTMGIAKSDDRIMVLPGEVINLIFAHLSPAALDAMRYTCKAWWIRIMGDVWLLRSVLGPCSIDRTDLAQGDRSPDPVKRLRQLAVQLDRQSKITHASSRQDCWRTHYQRVDTTFVVPPLQLPHYVPWVFVAYQFDAIVTAKYWSPGDLLVLLVKQKTKLAQSIFDITPCPQPARLLLYTFSSSTQPLHIGIIPCSQDSTTLEINHGDFRANPEIRTDCTTCFEIVLDKEVIYASLTSRSSFGECVSPFKLEVIDSFGESSISRSIRSIGDELIINEQLTYKDKDIWELLVGLYVPTVKRRFLNLFVAKRLESGTLFLVNVMISRDELSAARELKQDKEVNPASMVNMNSVHIRPLASIKPPKSGVAFRNVATGYCDQSLSPMRVAIIWQNLVTDDSELYLHELEGKDMDGRLESLSVASDSLYTDPTGQATSKKENEKSFRARRVASVPRNVGGIHVASPLLETSRHEQQEHKNLSGLQIVTSETLADSLLKREAIFQILLWGPYDINHHISLTAFNLAPETPAHQQRIVLRLQNHPLECDNPFHDDGSGTCTCPLHDSAYHVKLPSATFSIPQPPPKLPRPRTIKAILHSLVPSSAPSSSSSSRAPPPANYGSSVTSLTTSAQEAASKRIEERSKRWVKALFDLGLDARWVHYFWITRKWTCWGSLPLPRDWRELGGEKGRVGMKKEGQILEGVPRWQVGRRWET